jgi:hypothetical protein
VALKEAVGVNDTAQAALAQEVAQAHRHAPCAVAATAIAAPIANAASRSKSSSNFVILSN